MQRGPTLTAAPLRAVAIGGFLADAVFAAEADGEATRVVADLRSVVARSGAVIPLVSAKLNLIEGGVKLRAGDAVGAIPLLENALAERETRLSPASPPLAEACEQAGVACPH